MNSTDANAAQPLEAASKAGHLPYLDGWRGMAIVLVLLFHFFSPWTRLLGAFGVFMFFALSGMLISRLLFLRDMHLPTFFFRRFSRILPTFWLFTVAMVVYAAYFQDTPYQASLSEIAAMLSFLRTYFPSNLNIWSGQMPTGHFWSLNVEEHSYVFLALVALIFGRGKYRIGPLLFLIGTTLVIGFVNYYEQLHPPGGASWWPLRTEVASICLVFSATYCLLKESGPIAMLRKMPSWIPICVFVLAAAAWALQAVPPGLWILVPFCALGITVNHLDTAPAFLRRLLSSRILRWFGKCSFSIYLWQQPFYMKADALNAYRIPLLALAIALGAASFYLFENPIRQSLNRFWDQRQQRIRSKVRKSENIAIEAA